MRLLLSLEVNSFFAGMYVWINEEKLNLSHDLSVLVNNIQELIDSIVCIV